MATDQSNRDTNQALPSNATTSQGDQQHDGDQFVETLSAAIPPGMQRKQQMSADEILKEMNRVPLFMTSLDETDGEGGENDMLEAIKALAYEGTKAEVGENFREQGNEAARAKLWKDAREFYTKAIQTLRGQVETVDAPEDPSIKVTEEPDEDAEKAKEKSILEACLSNRALCNLEMKNYGSCKKDCAATLLLNPKNVKAWYRAASACLALDKLAEAQDACTSGLQFDASNAALQTLSAKVAARRDHLAALEQARRARAEREASERATLSLALRQRNVVVKKTDSPPEMEDANIALSDPNDANSELAFPVLFLYPLAGQTDFVKAVGEQESLSQHLEYILPVPWDEAQEYKLEDVECYMETTAGGLIKAGKKLDLIKLLGSGKLEIVDGLVRVFVVPKAKASEWIGQFKLRRGKQ